MQPHTASILQRPLYAPSRHNEESLDRQAAADQAAHARKGNIYWPHARHHMHHPTVCSFKLNVGLQLLWQCSPSSPLFFGIYALPPLAPRPHTIPTFPPPHPPPPPPHTPRCAAAAWLHSMSMCPCMDGLSHHGELNCSVSPHCHAADSANRHLPQLGPSTSNTFMAYRVPYMLDMQQPLSHCIQSALASSHHLR